MVVGEPQILGQVKESYTIAREVGAVSTHLESKNKRLSIRSKFCNDLSEFQQGIQCDAPPQIELPYGERQRNVRGAFRCTRSLEGARISVVDDVMTTGATLDEIARTLKAAGAAHVENWVVTRTPLHA